MKKGLVIGNSQVGALRMADAHFAPKASVEYLSLPGGNGPKLRFQDGRVLPDQAAKLIKAEPDHLANGAVLAEYDFIVFSALGLAAPRAENAGHIANRFQVAGFAPSIASKADDRAFASKGFMAEAIGASLRRMAASHSLRALAQNFKGPIYVQPFPIPNELLAGRDDSTTFLPGRYGYALGQFQGWYHRVQFDALADLVGTCGDHVRLLEYPDESWLTSGFTPKSYAQGQDCWHMNDSYGALVIGQICNDL